MRGKDRVSAMTNSESIIDLGPNAYGQPTAALTILRENVLGREAFDHAFKTYARRWMFKRPTPADFFRTMEDASGVDLDWFWRGWFYGVDHVDVSVDEVRWLQLDTRDPAVEKPKAKAEREAKAATERAEQERIEAQRIAAQKAAAAPDREKIVRFKFALQSIAIPLMSTEIGKQNAALIGAQRSKFCDWLDAMTEAMG